MFLDTQQSAWRNNTKAKLGRAFRFQNNANKVIHIHNIIYTHNGIMQYPYIVSISIDKEPERKYCVYIKDSCIRIDIYLKLLASINRYVILNEISLILRLFACVHLECVMYA